MPLYSDQLPERVREVIPLIQARLTIAVKHHVFQVHMFDPNGKLVVFDTVSADVVAYVTARIIERLMQNGTIRFQGMAFNQRVCRLLTQSVERVVSSSYEGKYFFLNDSKELIACALFLFIMKQHVVVRTPTSNAPQKKQRTTLSLPRPTTASLH